MILFPKFLKSSKQNGGPATDFLCSDCIGTSDIATGTTVDKIGGKTIVSGATSAKDGDRILYGYTYSANPVVVCTAEYDTAGRTCSIKCKLLRPLGRSSLQITEITFVLGYQLLLDLQSPYSI